MTLTRCSICKFDEEKRAAINDALCGGVSLEDISRSTGASKSSIYRHGKHLASSSQTPLVPCQDTAIPVPESPTVWEEPVPAPPPTKSQLLERVELLWRESMDGLAASKRPIVLRKPGGGEVQLPGDLRAQCSFIKVATSIAELAARATGELSTTAPVASFGQVIQVINIPKQPGTPMFAKGPQPGPDYSKLRLIDVQAEAEEVD